MVSLVLSISSSVTQVLSDSSQPIHFTRYQFSLDVFCNLGSLQPHRCFPEDQLQELAEVLHVSGREISYHHWNDTV